MTHQMETIGYLENTTECLMAIATLSYVLRVLGLFVAEQKVTFPPILRLKYVKVKVVF